MREIIFRGKQIDNDEWVYGSFIPDLREVYNGDQVVDGYIKPFGKTKEERMMVAVDRSTVGQYTGLKDKNGTKMFEGDIVRITDEHESIYDCNCGVGDIQFKYGHWYVLGKPQNSLWDLCDCYYCEVIGNIYDNPELLKESEK